MLSKSKIKLIHSLNRKKDRDESGFFLVEGIKMVEEALRSNFKIELLVCSTKYANQHPEIQLRAKEIIESDSESIQKASLLQNPQDVLAVVSQNLNVKPELNLTHKLVLALDFIQDPGNLGTILRVADWFGIQSVICSGNTVDVYNPKVVQASMGAIFRVKTWYTSLEGFIGQAAKGQIPVYGTFLEGKNIYHEILAGNGIIVLGNEGNGISPEVANLVAHKVCIPSFSSGKGSESLNVAIAAAICCSEFRRR
ncbi:MAG: RNA methyltransferase [Bacteroidia bacterium]